MHELQAQLAGKDALIESLKAEVIRLRRWRFGASAEAIDVTVAPELPLSGGEAVKPTRIESRADPASLPRLVSVDAPRERRSERRALRELPVELPRVIRVHEPASCQCPDCGAQMRRLGEDTSEQLDYVPGYFQVIRHIRPKLACRACARIVQAPAPTRPIERALPTAALLAQVIGAKYADHCPLYRQEGIYRRSGLELPRAMLADWARQAARLLDPLVSALERQVLSARKIHADDTPVPVLAPGKGRTRTGRLWAYVRDDRPSAGPDPPAVVYRYSPDRKGERPRAHLASFSGTLQADGYSGFNGLYESGRIREAACWAHYAELPIMPRVIANAALTAAVPGIETPDNTRAVLKPRRGRRASRASVPRGALARPRGRSGPRTVPRRRASSAGSSRRTDWSWRCWHGRDSRE